MTTVFGRKSCPREQEPELPGGQGGTGLVCGPLEPHNEPALQESLELELGVSTTGQNFLSVLICKAEP